MQKTNLLSKHARFAHCMQARGIYILNNIICLIHIFICMYIQRGENKIRRGISK